MARLLRMPEVAANAENAVVAGWPIAENTPFAVDDAIAVVETEKAVVDVVADAPGVILKVLVAAGSEVRVGDPIALLGDVGEPIDDLDALLVELGAVGGRVPNAATGRATEHSSTPADRISAATTAPAAAAIASVEPGAGSTSRIFSSPLARRLARDSGVSLAEIIGTGQGGRIVRRDVDGVVEQRAKSHTTPDELDRAGKALYVGPAEPSAYVDIPHTRMRRAIAARLTDSTRDAPHFFVYGTARVDKLLRLRARVNNASSTKVTVNDLVVMAAAGAHVLVPAMNVIWTTDAVRSFSRVDISIAVATDRGLVTPVLRGVEQMKLSTLAAAARTLVDRARSGELRQDDLEGGTLTVTNLGAYGTPNFAAIINPPQAAILAVGAATRAPIVVKKRLRVGTQMNLTLSVDHRPIDGVVAAQWLAALVSLLEEPARILA
jgi:pyruvate dehydrogenase E2 component (dihydrolipoamide acetyltransferase)